MALVVVLDCLRLQLLPIQLCPIHYERDAIFSFHDWLAMLWTQFSMTLCRRRLEVNLALLAYRKLLAK